MPVSEWRVGRPGRTPATPHEGSTRRVANTSIRVDGAGSEACGRFRRSGKYMREIVGVAGDLREMRARWRTGGKRRAGVGTWIGLRVRLRGRG